MARAAFATVGAGEELTFVLILMAVHTLFVTDFGFVIGRLVALLAGQAGVLRRQREIGFVVIE
jgi:hypothetical protein